MRKAIIIIICILSVCADCNAWNIFVPDGGAFKQIAIPDSARSLNGVSAFLNYPDPKYYSYFGGENSNESIFAVCFKSFSSELLYVATDDAITSISKRDVMIYLKDFDYGYEFDAYNRESSLDEAIEAGSLDKEFFCEVLKIPRTNGNTIRDTKHGYVYTFDDNGILISWKSLDGLSTWAKEYKETYPEFYNAIYNYAKTYWGTNKAEIINEVNAQLDGFSHLPGGWGNEYLDIFHIQGEYVYNFAILSAIINKKQISLPQFKKLTHNKCVYVSTKTTPVGKIIKYRYKNVIFLFDDENNLIDIEA